MTANDIQKFFKWNIEIFERVFVPANGKCDAIRDYTKEFIYSVSKILKAVDEGCERMNGLCLNKRESIRKSILRRMQLILEY